ncbi:T9SS type A sorting domain-containing protein, partial [candidate division WOR-3 bacterium]|nr:T9SS type A sorting domain-containing protein [candidate division WOR-3 bacterium]
NRTDLLLIGDRGLHNHFEDEMNKPSGVSIVEENGRVKYLYIADTNNDRIVRYNLDMVYEDKKAQIASLAGNELSIEQFLPYPNPTSDESNIRVVLSKPADIVINIFTITGKLVYTYNAAGVAGINEVIWTGINTAGATVLNGVYNIQVIATNGNESVERWSKIAIIR